MKNRTFTISLIAIGILCLILSFYAYNVLGGESSDCSQCEYGCWSEYQCGLRNVDENITFMQRGFILNSSCCSGILEYITIWVEWDEMQNQDINISCAIYETKKVDLGLNDDYNTYHRIFVAYKEWLDVDYENFGISTPFIIDNGIFLQNYTDYYICFWANVSEFDEYPNEVRWLRDSITSADYVSFYNASYDWPNWGMEGLTETNSNYKFQCRVDCECQSNKCPEISNENPHNETGDYDPQPLCQVDINDYYIDYVTVNFYNSSDGSTYYHQQTNEYMYNETVFWNYSQATEYNTNYYWKVTAFDGKCNISKWYNFTTIEEEIVEPEPSNNGSINNVTIDNETIRFFFATKLSIYPLLSTIHKANGTMLQSSLWGN